MKKSKGTRIFVITMLLSLLFTSIVMPGQNWQVEAAGTAYDAVDISFAPGKDESEYNFSWYSEKTTEAGVIQYAKVTDGEIDFPVEDAVEVQAHIGEASPGFSSHKAIIKHIENPATYMYRLGDGKGNWTEPYTFQTYPTDDYHFLLMGDPQIGSSKSIEDDTAGWVNTINKANEKFPNASFIFSAGDQVNNSRSEEEYTGYFAPELLKNIPTATTIGNHDNSEYYKYHFNVPNESDKGLTSAGGNYHFTHGDSLFIVLNSNNRDNEEHSEYLKEVVRDNQDAKWKFVMLHHSFYSVASHSQEARIIQLREDLVPTMDELEIDVVLAGHDHSYARTYQMLEDQPLKNQVIDENGFVVNPKGTVYLTANSASGSKYYSLKPDHEYYSAVRQQLRVPTFTNIHVTPKTIQFDTYRVDTMEVVDSYAILKDPSIEVAELELESVHLEANETTLPLNESNFFEDVYLTVSGKSLEGNDYDILPSQIKYKTEPEQVLQVSNRGHVTLTDEAQAGKVKVWAEITDKNRVFKSNEVELTIVNHEELELFSKASNWKYKDDGSDQGTAWRAIDFDDSNWRTGKAPLGYPITEERPMFGTVNTVIEYGPDSRNKYATSYFRTTFNIDDLESIGDRGYINFGIDDSVILYLNGTEIGRFNLPDGDITYDIYSGMFDGQGVADESRYETFMLNKLHLDLLVEGENVLAAEVHQDRPTSSDLYWDMEMKVIKGESESLAKLDAKLEVENNNKEKSEYDPGDIVNYTITVKNLTEEKEAKSLVIDHELNELLSFVPDSLQLNGQPLSNELVEGQAIKLALDSLSFGEELIVQFQAKVKDEAAGKRIEQTATIQGANLEKIKEPKASFTVNEWPLEEGKIILTFVNEDNEEVAKSLELSGELGSNYSIEPKEIAGYEYLHADADLKGKFVEGNQTITLYYKKVASDDAFEEGVVTTIYVDEAGEEIAEANIATNAIGTAYETLEKEIPGYELVDMSDNHVGEFTKDDITVTYTYKLVEEVPFVEGKVMTKYVDESGEEIAKQNIATNIVGEAYETVQKDIKGYEFITVEGETVGRFREDLQIVTYVYQKTAEQEEVAEGEVTVIYLDQNGEEIAERVVLTGAIQTPYETIQKEIANYKFIKVEGTPTGNFSDETVTVKYIYEKIDKQEEPTEVEEDEKPTETEDPKEVEDPKETEEPAKTERPQEEQDKQNNGSNKLSSQGQAKDKRVPKEDKSKERVDRSEDHIKKMGLVDEEASSTIDGKQLPKTATSNYLFVLVGIMLILAGFLFIFVRRQLQNR